MTEQITKLPKDWKVKKLEDLLDYIQPTKYIVKSTDYNNSYKTPVLTAGKTFVLGKTDETEGIFDSLPVIIFDDFTTANKLVNFKFKVKSSAMKILKPKDKDVNLLFVYYYIQTIRISFDTHKRYWISVFSKLSIGLPSTEEQNQIVSKIEELFSELDKGIEDLKTAQQQLKTYRQSVLKCAFEGKLTNENVKDGELPKGWEMVQIKDVASTYGGYAFKSGEFKSEGKYQVLRMGNVRPGIVRYDENPVFLDIVEQSVLNRSLLNIDDVIITQTGTRKKRDYGFTTLISKNNLLLNQRIASIRFNETYSPKFFLYYSWTDLFKDQFFANETGNVGQGNVGMNAVTETFIPNPTLNEQHFIVQEIESRLSVADKMEESIAQSLQQAEALRQSILKKAFSGELV